MHISCVRSITICYYFFCRFSSNMNMNTQQRITDRGSHGFLVCSFFINIQFFILQIYIYVEVFNIFRYYINVMFLSLHLKKLMYLTWFVQIIFYLFFQKLFHNLFIIKGSQLGIWGSAWISSKDPDHSDKHCIGWVCKFGCNPYVLHKRGEGWHMLQYKD